MANSAKQGLASFPAVEVLRGMGPIQTRERVRRGLGVLLLLIFAGSVTASLAQEAGEEPDDGEVRPIEGQAQNSDQEPTRRRILTEPVSRSGGLRLADGLKKPFNLFGRALGAGALQVEKNHALARLNDLFAAAVARGYEPLFGGLGTGAGFAFGVNLVRKDLLPRGWKWEVPLEYSTNNFAGFGAYLTIPVLHSEKMSFRTGFHYWDRPEEDFYGFGPRSAEEDRSNFRVEKRVFTALLETRPRANLLVGFPVSFSNTGISEGEDDLFPNLGEQFETSSIPGVAEADLFSVGVFLDWDFRNHEFLPTAGGRVRVETTYFRDTGGQDFRFTRYSLEAAEYIPLDDEHVLVFRGLAVVNDEKGNARVPLSEMAILGGRQTMRGFREFRFRDDNAILLNFEYRWQVWKYADMILFFDEGQVAPEPGDYSLSNLRSSRGIGLRFRGKESQMLRIDGGHSKEGWRLYLSFNMVL